MAKYDTRIVGHKHGKPVFANVERRYRGERRNIMFNRADVGSHTRTGDRKPRTPKGG